MAVKLSAMQIIRQRISNSVFGSLINSVSIGNKWQAIIIITIRIDGSKNRMAHRFPMRDKSPSLPLMIVAVVSGHFSQDEN
jgi:hypothetical protein